MPRCSRPRVSAPIASRRWSISVHPGACGADFASRWPALADAQWFPALGDGACANVGSGAIGPSRIALTVGTSAAVRMILPRPPDQAWVVPDGLWAYRLDRQRAVLGGALSNGGNLLRWIWDTTGTDRDDETTMAAAALAPDSTGLTFLPFLAGERSPGWHDDASGVIAGLTLSTRPEQLIRAGMEAVAYRLADVYDALRPLASAEHEIVASGGAILVMPSWLQITADALGHTLIASTPGDESPPPAAPRSWRRSRPEFFLASMGLLTSPAARPGMLPTWRTTSATVSAGTARRGSSKRWPSLENSSDAAPADNLRPSRRRDIWRCRGHGRGGRARCAGDGHQRDPR